MPRVRMLTAMPLIELLSLLHALRQYAAYYKFELKVHDMLLDYFSQQMI